MAQQIKGKYISSSAIDGDKLLLLADQALRQEGPLGDVFELIKSDPLDEKVYIKGSEVGYKSQIDEEASARSAADSVLQGNIDTEAFERGNADSELSGRIDTEVSDRQAADSVLDGKIDVEKGRIDAILLASDADKDSFKEIVDLINSVDTENDNAFAAYVLSNDAAVAQEVSDRTSGDSTLQSNLDSETSSREAADVALGGRIDDEEAARVAADGVLRGELDGLESYTTIKSLNDAMVAEESARASGDQSLQNQINDIISNVDPLALDSLSEIVTAFQQADSDLNTAITNVLGTHTSELSTEISNRESGDATLQSNIDAEATSRSDADSALDSRVSVLESRAFEKETFVLNSYQISNTGVYLSHEPMPKSCTVFVGRLALIEGVDYEIYQLDKKVHFIGDMADSLAEDRLEVGDQVHVSYHYTPEAPAASQSTTFEGDVMDVMFDGVLTSVTFMDPFAWEQFITDNPGVDMATSVEVNGNTYNVMGMLPSLTLEGDATGDLVFGFNSFSFNI